jgi:hypothetical protein
LVFVCWRQELELHARDRYGALDQMSAELRQLREQRDDVNALAEALRTRDGWLVSVFKPLDHHGRYPQQGRRWGSP